MKSAILALLLAALVVNCQQDHPILGQQHPILGGEHDLAFNPSYVPPPPHPSPNFVSAQTTPEHGKHHGPHPGHHGPHHGHHGPHHGPPFPGAPGVGPTGLDAPPHKCQRGSHRFQSQNPLQINQDAHNLPFPQHPIPQDPTNPTKPTGIAAPQFQSLDYQQQYGEDEDGSRHHGRHGGHHNRRKHCKWGRIVLPIAGIVVLICLVKKCKKCKKNCRMQQQLRMQQQQQMQVEQTQPPMIVPVQRGLNEQLEFHKQQARRIETIIQQQQQQQQQMMMMRQPPRYMHEHPVYEQSMEPIYGQPVHGM